MSKTPIIASAHNTLRQHLLIICPAPAFKSSLLSRQLKLICARTSTERPKTEQNTMIEVTENEMNETASFSNYR